MKPIQTYTVAPALPTALEPLGDLAHNLWWCWNHPAIELFRRLDGELWETSGHNPVLLLGCVDQGQLEAALADAGFMAHVDRVKQSFRDYLAGEGAWFTRTHGRPASPLIAYFSAEFGLTECLSIFAGGLGLLAGDHLKSASDLGVPLVGVGLLYQEGYFRQQLNDAGWQQETYVDNDFHNLPLSLESGPDGLPLVIELEYPGRTVRAQIWRAQVGRVPLYLLDTNLSGNSDEDRAISRQLYGGDLEMRLKQEILLGIGGYRALGALGLQPVVYHMNEGHSAFLVLERLRRLVEVEGLSFAEAREIASASLIFTTHTPVAAGHDYFPAELMDRYLAGYPRRLGLSRRMALGLGRRNPTDNSESFGMTTLALRLAAYSNGVSQLHGSVSRRMWRPLWADLPQDEVPISHVTNGVHLRSWISREMDRLYDRYVGPDWWEQPTDQVAWQRGIARVPAEELWRTHELRRERLVAFARRRLRASLERRGARRAELDAADEVLDLEALTIGFARRFATYKRATLVLHDADRLARLLTDSARPVQLIFSGKAHPRDEPGKDLIRQIVRLAREEPFRRRLVFLEDYDVAVARALVQGADLWLNTPQRPLEASGTSGMKAAANGVLNASTLDGWWAEAWQGHDHQAVPIGWAIGRGEQYEDLAYQDQVEAEALYELLERDVVQTFYERGADGLPRRWIASMKASIGYLCPFFNTHRMVREYTERFYLPAAARVRKLEAESMARARALAAWRTRVQAAWPRVAVQAAEAEAPAHLRIGDSIRTRARVFLAGLAPEDVTVQLYVGRVDARGDLTEAEPVTMQRLGPAADGSYTFEAMAALGRRSGLSGFTVRVLPAHPDLVTPFQPGLITWAPPEAAELIGPLPRGTVR
jgi:glycogen phosphorylase